MSSELDKQLAKDPVYKELCNLGESISRRISCVKRRIRSVGECYSLDINKSFSELSALLPPDLLVFSDKYASLYADLNRQDADSPFLTSCVSDLSLSGSVLCLICLKSRLSTLEDKLEAVMQQIAFHRDSARLSCG